MLWFGYVLGEVVTLQEYRLRRLCVDPNPPQHIPKTPFYKISYPEQFTVAADYTGTVQVEHL